MNWAGDARALGERLTASSVVPPWPRRGGVVADFGAAMRRCSVLSSVCRSFFASSIPSFTALTASPSKRSNMARVLSPARRGARATGARDPRRRAPGATRDTEPRPQAGTVRVAIIVPHGRSVPSSSGVRADGVGGARRRARGPVDDRCAQEERSRCLACATADARASAECGVRRWEVRTSAGGRSTWQVSRRLRPQPTARVSTRNRHLAALVRITGGALRPRGARTHTVERAKVPSRR